MENHGYEVFDPPRPRSRPRLSNLEEAFERFEKSLYHIGKDVYKPQVCVTLTTAVE